MLVWWALLLPVYTVTLLLCVLAYPHLDWLTFTVYGAGSIAFVLLFVSWRRASGASRMGVKIWAGLMVLDYFCLGCTMTVATSPVFKSSCPDLFLLPLGAYFVVRAVRGRIVRGIRAASRNEEP